MSNINYEQEVKKIYPYAYGQRVMGIYLIVDGENEDYEGGEPLGEICHSEEASWESAYNTLKQQNKI